MDPLTIGLMIAAIAAGAGIKRAAAPPVRRRRSDEVDGAPEVPPFFGIPPHAFGGGLRPPVTHKEIARERTIEAERGGGSDDEERDIKVSLTPGSQAGGVSAAPDVAGSPSGSRDRAPTSQQWAYVPSSGKWGGGYVLYTVGAGGQLVGAPPSANPVGNPVSG